jgi:hypothetical protein
MKFICDCANLRFKTIAALIEHVEKEHLEAQEEGSQMKIKAVPFVPGQTCNYCGRSRYEARKELCPGPWGSRFWDGRHDWAVLKEAPNG